MTEQVYSKKQHLIGSVAVYLIFTVSGASALVYQIIWGRWLGLVFGNTTLSVSIVLGSFMLGLAAGSWLAGRTLHRIANPLRFYAFMEFGIGVFAFCFPWITKLVDLTFTQFISTESITFSSIVLRSLLSILVLIIPTTFMGATLPLLADFFKRTPRHSRSWRVGILYAANTFGAALGIILASFILIETLGVIATTYVAAGLNMLVAAIAYLYSIPVQGGKREMTGSGRMKLAMGGRYAVVLITISGLLALASEVLWTRTLETIIGNSTYAFATIVLVYLLGIAAGSWIISLFVNRMKALPTYLAALFLGMGLWSIIAIGFFEVIVDSITKYKAMMVPVTTILSNYLKAISILFPLAFLSGACFPIVTRVLDPGGEDAEGILVARAYAWNTIGALFGSFAAGFIIAPFLDFLNSLYMVSALYCLTAVIAFAFTGLVMKEQGYRMRAAFLLGVVSAGLAFFAFFRSSDSSYYVKRFNERNPEHEMVSHEPGLQGVTSVILHKTIHLRDMLLHNGLGMTTKAIDTKMMAHLPMVLNDDPGKTLVICLGMGTTYRSAISHGKDVTVVELVKGVVDAFDYFYKDAYQLKNYPRGRIVINDGRNFLKLTREKFDVITIDPPPPIDAAGINNLYSKEFIILAKSRLNKGGIMAHWIPLAGSRAGIDDPGTQEMLIRSFADVFPFTYVHMSLKGIGIHIIGSDEPINFDQGTILSRLADPEVKSDINEWGRIPNAFFTTGWFTLPASIYAEELPRVTDNNPLLEFYLIRAIITDQKKMQSVNFW